MGMTGVARGLRNSLRKFLNIKTTEEKVKNGGERQAARSLQGISPDHLARYRFAAQRIPKGAKILDMACGVGYGSSILADSSNTTEVTAVDLSADAIEYGRKYYGSPKIRFLNEDCLKIKLEPESFDFGVSFETVEHIEQAPELLAAFRKALKPGALFILSTPNEDYLPYSKASFPYHVRHYRKDDLEKLIASKGFSIVSVHSQTSKQDFELRPGWNGNFNIVICKRN